MRKAPLALLAAVAMTAAFATPSKASNYELGTSRGEMRLHVDHSDRQVWGEYGNYGFSGRLQGRLDSAGGITGIWEQASGEFRCDRPVEGRWFWGRFSLAPLAYGELRGRFSVCDGPQDRGWSGHVH